MFKAVILDWDGTLADTKRAIVESCRRVLIELGCLVDDEFIERRIGTGTRKTLEDALNKGNLEYDNEMLEELTRKKNRLQADLFEYVNLFEGAIELLDELYGRIKNALATMSSREVMEKLLYKKGVEKYFDVVVTADEVSKLKPDPEIFLISAKKLNVDPKDCVVVEDSIFGVKAAKAAGIRSIAITSGAYTKEELKKENPDLLVDSIVEKDKILGFIFTW